MAAGSYYYILLTVYCICHRSSLPPGGQQIFPKHFTCLRIESPQVTVETGGRKYQVTCSYNSAPEINRAPVFSTRMFLRIEHIPQWHFPLFKTRIHVYSHQRT